MDLQSQLCFLKLTPWLDVLSFLESKLFRGYTKAGEQSPF